MPLIGQTLAWPGPGGGGGCRPGSVRGWEHHRGETRPPAPACSARPTPRAGSLTPAWPQSELWSLPPQRPGGGPRMPGTLSPLSRGPSPRVRWGRGRGLGHAAETWRRDRCPQGDHGGRGQRAGTCPPMRPGCREARSSQSRGRMRDTGQEGEKQGAGTPRETRDTGEQQRSPDGEGPGCALAPSTPGRPQRRDQAPATLDWPPPGPSPPTFIGLSDSPLAHVIYQTDYRTPLCLVGSGSLRSQAARTLAPCPHPLQPQLHR